ncbi:MAG: hypothetical protein NUW01_00440 [Gemmatimonadaceae bacterium]|nr:hypothetical protein [Gemmatimonadaceae bacterium]
MRKKAASKKKPASLEAFARAKRGAARRAACAVCALPDEVVAQVRVASDKKIDRRTIREWLEREYGIRIRDDVFTTHANSRSHREEEHDVA